MAQKTPQEKEGAVVDVRDVSIALDRYADIYSDFDPRPFSTRAMSDDFIKELERRILTDVKGKFEIRFFLPSKLRHEKTEAQIVKRLHAYFRNQAKEAKKENQGRVRKGLAFIATGFIALFTFAFLLESLPEDPLLTFLEILLVPVGWFFTWEGLGKLLLGEHDKAQRQIAFYQNLSKANFIFLSEDENVPGAKQEKAAPPQAKS